MQEENQIAYKISQAGLDWSINRRSEGNEEGTLKFFKSLHSEEICSSPSLERLQIKFIDANLNLQLEREFDENKVSKNSKRNRWKLHQGPKLDGLKFAFLKPAGTLKMLTEFLEGGANRSSFTFPSHSLGRMHV